MKRILLLISILIAFNVQAQDVTNARFEQRGDNVYITYHLSENATEVSIEFSEDGGVNFVPIYQVSGDVGANITRGEKLIIWSVLKERDKVQGGNCVFRISAKPKPKREPEPEPGPEPEFIRPSYFKCKFGTRVGVGTSSLSIDEYVESHGKNEINVFMTGFFLDFKITKIFALQVEALYTRMAFENSFLDEDYDILDDRMKLNYFHIPILLKLDLGNYRHSFALYAGPQFGCCFSARHSGDNFFDFDDELSVKADSDTFGADISCVYGVMVKFVLMDFDLRWTNGWTNFQSDFDAKYNSVQLSMGVRF